MAVGRHLQELREYAGPVHKVKVLDGAEDLDVDDEHLDQGREILRKPARAILEPRGQQALEETVRWRAVGEGM